MPDRTVRAVPRFLKSKRGFPEAVQKEIDARVRGLIEEPLQGAPKAGALKGVRVIKFKVSVRQYLLAYRFFAKPNARTSIGISRSTWIPGNLPPDEGEGIRG